MTDMPPFTARNVAKFVVTATVHAKTAALTRTTIVNQTPYETTDTPVFIASNLAGWYVSSRVKPYTDMAVDKTADFVTSKRESRRARKSAKKSETE